MLSGSGFARVAGCLTAILVTAGSISLTVTAASAATATVHCPQVSKDTGALTPPPAPGVDWAGCNLTGAYLPSADLSGANLSKANAAWVQLEDANLSKANLSGADLANASLAGATLQGASLASADLTSVSAWEVTLTGADLGSATLTNAYLRSAIATGASMQDAQLTGADLTGASLAGANLSGADFGSALVASVDLTGAKLSNAKLAGVALTSPSSGGLVGQPASLPASWSVIGGWLIGPSSDNLGNADLAGLDLSGSDLAGADLAGADLSYANLANSNLSHAQASSAKVPGTVLTGANVTDFTAAGLSGTPASLPANCSLVAGFLLGPGVALPSQNLSGLNLAGVDLAAAYLPASNLSGTDLSNTDLAGANLSSATLTGADIAGAVMSPITLKGVTSGALTGTPASLVTYWTLLDGYLLGPGAQLAQANLSGADLANVELSSANLSGADLSDVNLTNGELGGARVTGAALGGANLTGVLMAGISSGGVTGIPAALPVNWSLVGGYLVGPGASLEGAALSNADLAGADLYRAQLLKADLSGADLTVANLKDTAAERVTLAGANLSGADLTGSELAYGTLTSANLTGANLTDATLNLANLDGATISGATWTSARWYNTVCPDGTNSNSYLAGCFSSLDTIAPVASPTLAPGAEGSNGWYNTELQVNWNWTDNGTISGTCTPWTTGDTNGDPLTLTATCTDLAGNVGHASYQVKLDMTPPAVSVTGVRSDRVYALGKVPRAGCRTTQDVSGVGTAAQPSVTTTGVHGVGEFTATCSGATSVAGLSQVAPVHVKYRVEYGFSSFAAPRPGSSIAKSARHIAVTFRLADAAGHMLTGTRARQLAASHRVEVSLKGPGIKAATALCSWTASAGEFRCVVPIPAGARTGASVRYSLTASEDAGGGFATAPRFSSAGNPEVIHFE